MILFEKDWEYYPSAIVHLTTRNESWVHLAKTYKAMGIKNHVFHLALINPALEFIDPHSPNLTQNEIDMIAAECKVNPWYYFREVARIPPQAGGAAVPLQANRGNIAMWWCFFNHITMCLIQPRQTGKSYTVYELYVYLLTVLCQGTLVNMLTKDEKLRKESVDIVKKIFDQLPEYLDLRNKRTDSNNTEEITVNLLENKLKTFLPRSSEKDALNVGRGFGCPINHVDEGPFCVNAHISIPAMFSAGNAVRDRAKAAGTPYCNIVTTTAGKLDTEEGAFVYKNYIVESMTWSELVFDQPNAEELEIFVRKGGHGNFRISIIMSHRQLGKTDEWLWEKMRESNSEGDAADRDYFNVWTSGTESHPLKPAVLKRIVASQNDIVYDQYFPQQKYVIKWNVAEKDVARYMAMNKTILSVDSSNAGGNDDTAMVWVDADTLDVVAAAAVNETNLLVYANWLAVYLVENKNVTLIIESKSSGPFIIDVLCQLLPSMGEDPFKRIFNLIVQDRDVNPDRYEMLRVPLGRRDEQLYTLNKDTFGFNTSGSGRFARSELYGTVLQEAAKRGGDKVYDKKLIGQITGLKSKNGRVDHGNGKHDDMVIAWLMAVWFLMNGKNMMHYGISSIMTQIGDEKAMTYEEYLAHQKQQELQNQVQDLSVQLEETSDPYLADKLEHQIRMAARGMVYSQGHLTNIDQFILEIKDKKKKRLQMNSNRITTTSENDNDYYRDMMGLNRRNAWR